MNEVEKLLSDRTYTLDELFDFVVSESGGLIKESHRESWKKKVIRKRKELLDNAAQKHFTEQSK